ncbi:3654_t:CDS:2 [Gigaspora rosea]|nr:3654_t:CDS:2 [Gigaspora rosea]
MSSEFFGGLSRDFGNHDNTDILDLLIASDELLLSELFEHIQEYLLSTKSDWVKRNVVKVHRTIYPYDGFWPFNKILPENLKEDIIRYHFKRNAVINSSNGLSTQSLIPNDALKPRKIPFDSTLIKAEHVAKLCDWIDRKDGKPYSFDEIPYKFKLLIRGSRDGFEAETFHEKCDNKGATIVVMQIAYSGELVGGYNPIEWTTGDIRLTTQNSFLFSFPKQGNLNDAKLSRVTRAGYAIRIKDKTHGPCFGDKDLWMKNNFNAYDSCSSDKDDYSDRVTTLSKFWVLEYEVFQVIRK